MHVVRTLLHHKHSQIENSIFQSASHMITRSKAATSTPLSASANHLHHDEKNCTFYITINSSKAYVHYSKNGSLLTLDHTEVPDALNGKGVGKMLAKEVFGHLSKSKIKPIISCDFLRHYISKYDPQYKDLL